MKANNLICPYRGALRARTLHLGVRDVRGVCLILTWFAQAPLVFKRNYNRNKKKRTVRISPCPRCLLHRRVFAVRGQQELLEGRVAKAVRERAGER